MEPQIFRPPMYRTPPLRLPPVIPLGLQALYGACRAIYPDQPNPLQVAALVKYWLGGPDPLDYISMYSNPGNPEAGIPPHWHYVSFGLSDLHGDGRVHGRDGLSSGFGFELTFRLARGPGDGPVPPTWPAAILQALAKYVFQTENTLCAGDHVSWHCPLDNSESRVQHMLMCEDPQLGTVATPFGPVAFVQIVGALQEELHAAQGWNGPGVVDLLRGAPGAGGSWLVTDMRRRESLFQLSPGARAQVDAGIAQDGSNLSGVSARCTWRELARGQDEEELERGFAQISVREEEQIKAALAEGLRGSSSKPPFAPRVRSPLDDRPEEEQERPSTALAVQEEEEEVVEPPAGGGAETRHLERVQVTLDLEAGTLLVLALRGRLLHGRHFTFKGVVGDAAVTLVPPGVAGAFVEEGRPLGTRGPWLQVLLQEGDVARMLADLQVLAGGCEALSLPKTFHWCGSRLLVTLMHEDY
ncbi:hypothetical protein JTE90_003188 [Oedothorax gibbosus]|uniref:Suppressor of fused homolog n=1 Tax=Oedothorax gibbosus TaxID=931172 RepID=A0AAV6US32_9ARAC|nr:hypothetical protein JTE90_003188 [Oedothorax gibbosus]